MGLQFDINQHQGTAPNNKFISAAARLCLQEKPDPEMFYSKVIKNDRAAGLVTGLK